MLSRVTRATLFLIAVLCGIGRASTLPSRALSLSAAVDAMRSGRMASEAESLCGITKISGYVTDVKSKDIVIIGKVDPSLPPLHLDDLVVALRNVWLLYTYTKGNVRYYADPGCSIDPDPRVLGQLRDLRTEPLDLNKPDQVKDRMGQWRDIGKKPQKVRVMGVPFDSHFAKVMVDADYYMKRLVNGTVTLPIDGFQSLTDLHTRRIRENLHAPNQSLGPENMINRFWFSPGDCTYDDGNGYVLLKSCDVKLLTEQEFLSEQGTITGLGKPDPLAGEFAKSFSQDYGEIGTQRPIYRELQGLFAFVGLARLLKDHNAHSVAPGAMQFLLTGYKLSETHVNRTLEGLRDVRTINEKVDSGRGPQVWTVMQSSCGGVSMAVQPKRVAAPRRSRGTDVASANSGGRSSTNRTGMSTSGTSGARPSTATDIKRTVLSSRKSPKALSWDVPAQFD